jgi:anionic cell wall polymer biosynthesis LytR-Cps2A-Psr (LCP) family protein
MGYVRIRHSDDDVHRAQRQHEFMEAMRAKITNRDTFLKLPNALNQITQNIASDLNPAQQLTIANFARTVPPQNLQVATLPSTIGRSFVYANVPESEKLISHLFFADRPDAVKVTVPEQSRNSSRRTLLARLNSPGHRRRHRRRRVVPAVHKEILGVILDDRNCAIALNRRHPNLFHLI